MNEIDLVALKSDVVAGRRIGASSPKSTVPCDDVGEKGLTGRMLTPHEIIFGKRITPKVDPNAENQCDQVLHIHGDNTAGITIAHRGQNPSIRHMSRTLGVTFSFVKGCIHNRWAKHYYI